jgi:hypothetical protein
MVAEPRSRPLKEKSIMGQIHHPTSGKTQNKDQKGEAKSTKAGAEEQRKAGTATMAQPSREDADDATLEGWDESENEGEGSRTAAREYNEGLQQAIASGDLDGDAEEARRALEGPEGEELRRAEQAGKRGKPTPKH